MSAENTTAHSRTIAYTIPETQPPVTLVPLHITFPETHKKHSYFHQLTHTNERKHYCNCGKNFLTSRHLKRPLKQNTRCTTSSINKQHNACPARVMHQPEPRFIHNIQSLLQRKLKSGLNYRARGFDGRVWCVCVCVRVSERVSE